MARRIYDTSSPAAREKKLALDGGYAYPVLG
jgi:hypothetical protein